MNFHFIVVQNINFLCLSLTGDIISLTGTLYSSRYHSHIKLEPFAFLGGPELPL